ncbi:hypothetical protein ACFWN7_01975 [Agromyces sp. NPDC058484]|uniref:hypothetical protein n=1 Tax=Agromyces sp. NPDC058484 TaxID=3346524 RepID=UPI00366959F9
MTTTTKTAAKKPPAKKAPAKKEAPAPTPEQVAAQKATEKAQATARTELAKVVAKKAELAEQERRIIATARQAGVSWQKLADALGMSTMGLRNRYLDLAGDK